MKIVRNIQIWMLEFDTTYIWVGPVFLIYVIKYALFIFNAERTEKTKLIEWK